MRAAQFAELQLVMVAREYDRRFFHRGVHPAVRVLNSVVIKATELPAGCALAKDAELLDALEHLNQCGSLLAPTRRQINELREAQNICSNKWDAAYLCEPLGKAIASCEALAAKFDCVVANPPYMGSSNFDKWTSAWVKKNYPDSKSDLCACFIERCASMLGAGGLAGLATSNVWMFLSSYEGLRRKMLSERSLVTLVQLSVHGFKGVAAQVCAFVISEKRVNGMPGNYIRLNDFDHHSLQGPKALEAIQNPDCGWFYRTDASTFKDIPGSPIAYWASEAVKRAFGEGVSIGNLSDYTGGPNITGDNDRYLRFWWEVSDFSCGRECGWVPYAKGGEFRKWAGNLIHVVDWSESARLFYSNNKTSTLLIDRYWYKEGITYTMLTSGQPSFRYMPPVGVFDKTGPEICQLGNNLNWMLGFFNSQVSAMCLSLLNPTMSLQVKDIKSIPIIIDKSYSAKVARIVQSCIDVSSGDWDLSEFSNNYKRHSLIGEYS